MDYTREWYDCTTTLFHFNHERCCLPTNGIIKNFKKLAGTSQEFKKSDIPIDTSTKSIIATITVHITLAPMDLLIAAVDTNHSLEQSRKDDEKSERNGAHGDSPAVLRRFPCKARGLGASHNTSGYLTLREGAHHGEELYCSSRECFLEGVKFRWCATCDKAVAKRNFKKRHSHSQNFFCSRIQTEKSPISFSLSSSNGFENRNVKPRITDDPAILTEYALAPQDPSATIVGKNDSTTTPDSQPPDLWSQLYFSRPTQDSGPEVQEWLLRVLNVSKQKKQSLADDNSRIESSKRKPLPKPIIETNLKPNVDDDDFAMITPMSDAPLRYV